MCLQGVGNPAKDLLKLLLLFLQHPDLGHGSDAPCRPPPPAWPRTDQRTPMPQSTSHAPACHRLSLSEPHVQSKAGGTRNPEPRTLNPYLLAYRDEMRSAVLDHEPSSCPGSNGNSFAVADRPQPVGRDAQRDQVVARRQRRRSPSARLYSAVPRSSEWPSIVTIQVRVFLHQRGVVVQRLLARIVDVILS